MAHPELLPYLFEPGTQTKQYASVDHSGNNDDGNFLKAFSKYKDENGEFVLFDEYGPGCLYRMQMNIWTWWHNNLAHFPDAGNARIKFYFDNEKLPRLNTTIDSLYGGFMDPFVRPLSFMDGLQRFGVSYYPMQFEKHLKITVIPKTDWSARGNTWHQFTYLIYPESANIRSWTGHEEAAAEVTRQWKNKGKDPKRYAHLHTVVKSLAVQEDSTRDLLIEGSGAISAIRCKLPSYAQEHYYNTFIKLYWDDMNTPAVSLPLGYFFGGGGQRSPLIFLDLPGRKLETLFFGYDGQRKEFYSYWPMPFWKKARIAIENKTTNTVDIQLQVDYTTDTYPREKTGYFFAKRTEDQADSIPKPFGVAFSEEGYGHVVGRTFYSDGYDMDGDEFTYIDGSRTPQIHGDGTEDDNNQGWGGSNFQEPLWGGLLNGFQGSYRIFMNDCYIFYDKIRMYCEFEKYAGLTSPKTDVTVFYYKKPGKGILFCTDEVNIGDPKSEEIHHYQSPNSQHTIVSSSYDGYSRQINYDSLTDSGNNVKNSSLFTVRVDPRNKGIRLRRRIDRFTGSRQLVTVFVDGIKVKERPWYTLYSSSVTGRTAWADTDFEIPASYTHGKSAISIRLEGTHWNEFYYWVYCYR